MIVLGLFRFLCVWSESLNHVWFFILHQTTVWKMSKNGSSQNLVDCHSIEKDLAKQVVFASQGLSFFNFMDTAVFPSAVYYTAKPSWDTDANWISLGTSSYTAVCSIPVHRLDESIRISDNKVSTDVCPSLQIVITGGRQWQRKRKRKSSRAGPALQSSSG